MGTWKRLRDQVLLVALLALVPPLCMAFLLACDSWYDFGEAVYGMYLIGVLGLVPGAVVLLLHLGGRALFRSTTQPCPV